MMAIGYVLKGNLRRTGVENPRKKEPTDLDLSKATLENRLVGGCKKIFQDPDTKELYIIQGDDLYKARCMENESNHLELRDKEFLARGFIKVPLSGRYSTQFMADGNQMCFMYDNSSKSATIKKDGYFGKVVSRLNAVNIK